MNKRRLTTPLIAIGLLALAGTAVAESGNSQTPATSNSTPSQTTEIQTAPNYANSDPWAAMHADMLRMRAEMDQMFDASMHNFPGPSSQGMLPSGGKVSLEEQGNNYVVKADIPGAKESDIQVNLNGRFLSISAQTQGSEQQKTDNGKVMQEESYASTFQRGFTLPTPVNASGMHSQFHDGVLTLTIPKATS